MSDPGRSAKLATCLATVYLVWGSSFLFTKIAVSNLPVALVFGMRFSLAGIILMLAARLWRGERLPARLVDWRHAIITGFFMVLVSNGLNTWSMKYMPSNQAALLNGSNALMIAGLGVFGPRGHPLTRWSSAGLLLGIAGGALILVPRVSPGAGGLLAPTGALLGCFGWSLGTLYYRSIDSTLSSLMFVGAQMLCGGLMLLAIGLAHGDAALLRWSPPGILAMGYLTFFSSCLAYTAYGWLTLNATPALLGSYSYVNPAIAAFLGWRFLHERLSVAQLMGMFIIIASVCLVTLPQPRAIKAMSGA